MFIVPYIAKPLICSNLKTIWLFLERNGNHLIDIGGTPTTAVQSAKEFLELNLLYCETEPYCIDNLIFAAINPTTSDLSTFYTWKETPPGTMPARELWRPFLWTTSEANQDSWGVNSQMESIPLSGNDTAYSILTKLARP